MGPDVFSIPKNHKTCPLQPVVAGDRELNSIVCNTFLMPITPAGTYSKVDPSCVKV